MHDMMEWEEKHKAGVVNLQDPPAVPRLPPQAAPLRNKRRSVFVARIQGQLRLCPVKNNMDLGGAIAHEWVTSLVVVKDATK